MFLTEIKRKFLSEYGLTVATAVAYGMNSEFSRVLAQDMKRYSDAKEVDALSRVHGQIDELKDIMVQNIDAVTARGERLELLVNQTENLRNNVSYSLPFSIPLELSNQIIYCRRFHSEQLLEV